MFIPKLSVYNTNLYKVNQNQNQQTFTGNSNVGSFIYKTYQNIEDVAGILTKVFDGISMKNEVGLEKFKAEFADIVVNKNRMVLKNLNKDGKDIILELPKGNADLFNFGVADGHSNQNFLIVNKTRLVKSYDGKNYEFMNSDELKSNEFEENFNKMFESIDSTLFRIRKYLINTANEDVCIPDGVFGSRIVAKIKETLKSYNEIDEITADWSNTKLLSRKREFGNYNLVSAQSAHEFTNAGVEGYNIVFAPVKTKLHNNLSRMVVSDKEGNVVKAYLVKDGEKLVSNINEKFVNYIPEKLKFYSKLELENGVGTDFKKYLDYVSDKIQAFKHFLLTARIHVPSLLPKADNEILNSTFKFQSELEDLLKSISPKQRGTVKMQYSRLEVAAGKAGYTFRNINENHDKIVLLPVANKTHESLSKIIVLSQGNQVKQMFLIKDSDKLISNFNPKYPNVIPPVLKIASSDDIEQSGMSEYLPILKKEMQDLKVYVSEQVDIIKNEEQQKLSELMKQKKEKLLQKTKQLEEKQQQQMMKKEAKKTKQLENCTDSVFVSDLNSLKKDFLSDFKEDFSNLIITQNTEDLFKLIDAFKLKIKAVLDRN